MEEIDGRSVVERTISIDLDEKPINRWRDLPPDYGDDLLELVGKLEEEYEWLLRADGLYPMLIRRLISGQYLSRLALLAFGVKMEEYGDEIAGLAKEVGLPLGKLLAANLTYELTQVASNWANACTSFSSVIDGQPVLARAMDWATPPGLGRYTRFIDFYNGDRYRYTAISFPGYVGVISAYSHQWAMTLNQAPQAEDYTLGDMPTTLRLRQVCDTKRKFAGMVKGIERYRTMTTALVHIVGTQPNERLAIEMHGDHTVCRPPSGQGRLAVANHFVDSGSRHLNDPLEFEQDGTTYYNDTQDRYEQALAASGGYSGIDLMVRALHTGPILNELTEQTMLLCPSDVAKNRYWMKEA